MPLKGKYLKYQPEITFDIFKLVWDRLLKLGWRENSNSSIESRLVEFTGKYPYFRHTTKNEFNTHEGSEGRIETTVQEILGYDPFVKEFVLPESWYIQFTKENLEVVTNWFNSFAKSKRTPNPGSYCGKANGNISAVALENGYACYTSNKCFDTEITFDQFKKYVLKDNIEVTKEEVIEEVIPEYVECINSADTVILKVGMIYRVLSKGVCSCGTSWYLLENVNLEKRCTCGNSAPSNAYNLNRFKPSTKEAFDAQNKPKQLLKQAVHCSTQEEWDFVNNIRKSSMKEYYKDYKDKSVIRLDFKNGYSDVLWAKNDGYQILSFQEWCDLNGYKMESNIDLTGRYLKALIDSPQSTTYKKGDIVEIFKKVSSNQYRIGKVGAVWWTYTTNNGTERQWELLPEDYKMGKEVKFEVGKWYKLNIKNQPLNYLLECSGLNGKLFYYSQYINLSTSKLINSGISSGLYSIDMIGDVVSIEEIQQYLPESHPDKIKSSQEFKVGDYIFVMIKGKNFGDILKVRDSFIEKKSSYSGVWINHTPSSFGGGGFRLNGNGYIYGKDVRHATPEEINQHLISIEQIPAGEPLNTGIEPNKDGMFKYTTGNSYDKDFSTSIVPGPLKMTLSIDNEELPMVDIIKTNSIKQLLNND